MNYYATKASIFRRFKFGIDETGKVNDQERRKHVAVCLIPVEIKQRLFEFKWTPLPPALIGFVSPLTG